ncbi:MFS transporter [Vagococcus sp. DIV0080]|uniref:MFS transporter n=1 Tax=Candidatus Vagococcus giribetii TaxID=2230876 RepID=A0ABS3HV63_9ENTE|nr:MFS transporter [Vagococcus sp. DIV0080]
MGNSLYNIVFIVYASTLSFNTLAVSLASVAIFIPSFFQPFVGHIADRTKQKLKWNILSRLIQFSLFLLLAGLILLEPSFPLFLALLLINVISDCFGFYSSALQLPYIKHVVPEENLMEAMGFQNACATLMQLIFQGFGAFLIVQLNYNFSLFAIINAATFLAAAFVILSHYKFLNQLTLTPVPPLKEGNSFKNDFKETMHLFLNNPFLKMIIIFAVLINLLGSSSDGLLNVSLLNRENLWFTNLPNTIALVGISTSLGLLLGSLLTKDFFKKVSSLRIISLILLNTTLLPIILLVIQSKLLLILSLFTLGYLLGKINPRISAYIISEVPQEKLGLTSGIFSILVMAGTPIGQFIFLGTANVFNDSLSWLLFGDFSILFLLVSLSYASKLSDPVITKH